MAIHESTQSSGNRWENEPNPNILDDREVVTRDWSVESALSKIHHNYAEETDSPVSFFHFLERLKTMKREGWRRKGIMHGESISDHMYRMSILTMLAPASLASRLDLAKCTRMALIHDMAEALVGDITPEDGIPKPEKSRREAETMDYVCNKLLGKFNGGLNARQIREIWQEYEDSKTLESQFVHDIDKIELLLQMVEYEREKGGDTDLGEFLWVSAKIQSAEVKAWTDHLLWERLELWQSFGKEPDWGTDKEGNRRDIFKPTSKPAPLQA